MRTATGGAGVGGGSCCMRITAMTKSNLARSRRSGTGVVRRLFAPIQAAHLPHGSSLKV